MKKISKNLFLIFIFVFPFYTQSQAQLGDRIKRAAERGVSNALVKKVESESEKIAMRQIEKALQNIYGEDFAKQTGMDFSKIMSGIHTDVETADAYHFSGYVIMDIKSTDEKGKPLDPMEIKTYISEDLTITALELEVKDKKDKKKKSEGIMIMIYDFNRNASIFLMESEGEKSSMTYGFDFEKMNEGINTDEIEEIQETPDYTFVKTGKTKTINGYSCEEYLMDSEDATIHYWISEKPISGNTSLWGQNNPYINSKIKNQNQSKFQNLPQGNILEMIFESKKDNSSVDILVKEINDKDAFTFSMAEYPNMFKEMEK